MSTLSSLFGTSNKDTDVDKNVDSLFKGSAGPISREKLIRTRTVIEVPEPETKDSEASGEEEGIEGEADEEEMDDEEEIEGKEMETRQRKKQKKKDMNEDLESAYFEKLLKEKKQEDRIEEKEDEEESESSDSGSDSDSETKEKLNKSKAARTVNLKETELEKAERTVFVGNVTASVIASKKIYKSFKKLFSQWGKIESIRFRSISFDEPLPRKVAFARKKLHNSRETLNSYVVFKEKEASLKAAPKLNATVFENCHLRVDHVGHPSPKDNKRTIFVGNLDFDENEETLWRYFNSKTDNDVESVRIIRDSKTNLGKGFALVMFKDSLSVNKALLLNDKPISAEKKRKLRINRARANAKPSVLSPNHIDNVRKTFASKKSKNLTQLNDHQKTKLGRAHSILGKADKATAGKPKKLIIEGQRATKGGAISGIKGLKGKRDKKGRVKKPRIRERSTKFKQERQFISKELSKK